MILFKGLTLKEQILHLILAKDLSLPIFELVSSFDCVSFCA